MHKVATQVCVLTETGEYAECRIRTEREMLTALFGAAANTGRLVEREQKSVRIFERDRRASSVSTCTRPRR